MNNSHSLVTEALANPHVTNCRNGSKIVRADGALLFNQLVQGSNWHILDGKYGLFSQLEFFSFRLNYSANDHQQLLESFSTEELIEQKNRNRRYRNRLLAICGFGILYSTLMSMFSYQLTALIAFNPSAAAVSVIPALMTIAINLLFPIFSAYTLIDIFRKTNAIDNAIDQQILANTCREHHIQFVLRKKYALKCEGSLNKPLSLNEQAFYETITTSDLKKQKQSNIQFTKLQWKNAGRLLVTGLGYACIAGLAIFALCNIPLVAFTACMLPIIGGGLLASCATVGTVMGLYFCASLAFLSFSIAIHSMVSSIASIYRAASTKRAIDKMIDEELAARAHCEQQKESRSGVEPSLSKEASPAPIREYEFERRKSTQGPSSSSTTSVLPISFMKPNQNIDKSNEPQMIGRYLSVYPRIT